MIAMAESPTPPSDFTPDPQTETAGKRSANLPLIIGGCAGCGCLGVIGLGLVSAIALPSFLNQADDAREAEAKSYVQSIMRGQQAYRIEQSKFASTIDSLGLGIKTETDFYTYKLVPAESDQGIIVYAEPKDLTLNGFAGAVYAVEDASAGETTYSALCEGDELGKVPAIPPVLDTDMAPEVVCPPGSFSVR